MLGISRSVSRAYSVISRSCVLTFSIPRADRESTATPRRAGNPPLGRPDFLHPGGGQVVDGDAEADRARHVRRPAFELERDVVPHGGPEVDLPDHLAATHERLHRLQAIRVAH